MKNLQRTSQTEQENVEQEPDSFLPSEVWERQRRAAALVLEWAKEDDGYDEEIWPLIEEEFGWKK